MVFQPELGYDPDEWEECEEEKGVAVFGFFTRFMLTMFAIGFTGLFFWIMDGRKSSGTEGKEEEREKADSTTDTTAVAENTEMATAKNRLSMGAGGKSQEELARLQWEREVAQMKSEKMASSTSPPTPTQPISPTSAKPVTILTTISDKTPSVSLDSPTGQKEAVAAWEQELKQMQADKLRVANEKDRVGKTHDSASLDAKLAVASTESKAIDVLMPNDDNFSVGTNKDIASDVWDSSSDNRSSQSARTQTPRTPQSATPPPTPDTELADNYRLPTHAQSQLPSDRQADVTTDQQALKAADSTDQSFQRLAQDLQSKLLVEIQELNDLERSHTQLEHIENEMGNVAELQQTAITEKYERANEKSERQINDTVSQMQAVSQQITTTAGNLKKLLGEQINDLSVMQSAVLAETEEATATTGRAFSEQESFDCLSEYSSKMEAMIKSERALTTVIERLQQIASAQGREAVELFEHLPTDRIAQIIHEAETALAMDVSTFPTEIPIVFENVPPAARVAGPRISSEDGFVIPVEFDAEPQHQHQQQQQQSAVGEKLPSGQISMSAPTPSGSFY
uniref:Uncharacterized protein n=1 Tax=Plectus sambesii TaxID=2011161 RepID=A0A914UXG0_9BILA